jgi:sugar phosphate permease
VTNDDDSLNPTSRLFLTTSFHLVFSPNNIITSAVAADLASHPSVRGNNKSLGTVTGLINGCGAITASIGLLAVGPLQEAFGWGSVWVFLIGCTTTGTLLMSTKIYSELFPKPEDAPILNV